MFVVRCSSLFVVVRRCSSSSFVVVVVRQSYQSNRCSSSSSSLFVVVVVVCCCSLSFVVVRRRRLLLLSSSFVVVRYCCRLLLLSSSSSFVVVVVIVRRCSLSFVVRRCRRRLLSFVDVVRCSSSFVVVVVVVVVCCCSVLLLFVVVVVVVVVVVDLAVVVCCGCCWCRRCNCACGVNVSVDVLRALVGLRVCLRRVVSQQPVLTLCRFAFGVCGLPLCFFSLLLLSFLFCCFRRRAWARVLARSVCFELTAFIFVWLRVTSYPCIFLHNLPTNAARCRLVARLLTGAQHSSAVGFLQISACTQCLRRTLATGGSLYRCRRTSRSNSATVQPQS